VCSAWDPGRPQDLELVRCCGRHHRLERGRLGGRRRERERLGRLGQPEQEVLEPGRLDHEEEARHGYVKVSLSTSLGDAFLEVFSGDGSGTFDSLSGNGCMPAQQPQGFFYLQAGLTYYFQVGTQSVEPGQIDLTVTSPTPAVNDDFGQATSINSLPFRGFVDISTATIGADDPTSCFNGIRSIWYQYTPTADTKLGLTQTLGQPYYAIYTGKRGSLQLVSCGAVAYGPVIDVKRGTTYYIEILDQQEDQFEFLVGEGFSFRTVKLKDEATLQQSTGTVTVAGSFACNQPTDATVTVDVTQRRGAHTVHGSTSFSTPCATTESAWSTTVVADSEQSFSTGSATLSVTVYGGGGPPFFNTDTRTVSQTVQITKPH